ncbi:MAG: fructosamine kinase family protein [Phycisphaerales bacterium]|nr:fructosamine kinase family protein [Phycisphaerales bacterium]MCI0630699.1 fructosamine kinase family protein [Phycisphaerales bacterium]MCI0674850.1 fructosamine kinase family protein [Phycisphaerales bacterium]
MNAQPAIERALVEAGLNSKIRSNRSLSGGCIHQVIELTLADGMKLVAKVNSSENKGLFEEEMHGLRALGASGAVIVPKPLSVVAHGENAALLMTAIEPPNDRRSDSAAAAQFGADLAALHQADVGERYGFEMDNHIGSPLQVNSWHDDWVAFNAVNRLGFQAQLAREAGLLNDGQTKSIEKLIDRLDRFIPGKPKPSLLHGDLWSGNALPTLARGGRGGTYAVIDPACSIGDGWADIAMMKLFGGFDESCFEAYRASIGAPDDVEDRLVVYQLYHVLNHVNIFGSGYVGQAMSLVRRLVG